MIKEELQTEEFIDQQDQVDTEAVDTVVEDELQKSPEESCIEDAIKGLANDDKDDAVEPPVDEKSEDESNDLKPGENSKQEEPKTEKEPKEDTRSDEEIAQSLKSERGRARFQEVLKEKAELEEEKRGYEEIVSGLQETLQSAKLTPEEFAQNIEFSRLRNSDNPNDVRVAFEMLEQERANLAMKLGIVAPGIDYLKDHPDVAKAYQDGKIDDNYALEIIRNRHLAKELEQNRQYQEQSQARQAQNQRAVQQSVGQINAYLESKKGEIDFPAKEKYISGILSDPAKVNELATTYEPHQWPHVIKMLYETASIPQSVAQPAKRSAQPISSRTSALGGGSVKGDTPEDIVASAIQMLGV